MKEEKSKNFNVFAYGSLRYPKCREKVIGRPVETMPATLEGYKSIKIPDLLYFFSWDNIPGNDSDRLSRSLKDKLDIVWAKNAEISKSDDGKTIHISKDGNSAEIMMDEAEEKATLKISGGKTRELKVKKGKNNL
jgi:hypothetical protein